MIQHPSQPKMNPYSEINPYYLIYCNMNIKISEQISKEAAENVVRQIGYLHNAMGHVFKDLVKILSFKFSNHPTTPMNSNAQGNKPTPSPKPVHQERYPQTMDVENQVVQAAPKGKNKQTRPQIQQRINVQDYARKSPIQIVQQFNQQQQKPPNTNIFDQYAYSIEPLDIKPKQVPSIRLTLSKGSEGPIKKKKQNKPNLNINEGKQQRHIQHKKQRKQAQKKPTPMIQPNLRIAEQKQGGQQQFDMFKQFMYQDGEQMLPKPQSPRQHPQAQEQMVKPGLQNGDQQPNQQIWGFLKNREQPQVFQISDDEQG